MCNVSTPRFEGSSYTYDGYLEDLSLAWDCAMSKVSRQIEANQEPGVFAESMRYLLIRTSINSIAGNYVPELVVRAVEVGLWAPQRALSLTVKIPDAAKRIEMYAAILATGRLGKEQQEEVQRLALDMALALEHEEERAKALAALAPQLPQELRIKALEQTLADVPVLKDEEERAKVLVALAPQLTGEMLERALEAALTVQEAGYQVDALVALVPRLTGELRLEALRQTFDDIVLISKARELREGEELLNPENQAVVALMTLVKQELARTEVLAAASALKEGEQGVDAEDAVIAWVLEMVALVLKEESKQAEALDAALALGEEEAHGWMLVALAPGLRGRSLKCAVYAALAFKKGKRYRAAALAALAQQLAGKQRHKVLIPLLSNRENSMKQVHEANKL